MKKLIVLLLALALCLGLCACGEDQQPLPSNPNNNEPAASSEPTDGSSEGEHTHEYKKDVVAPDCVNTGYTLYTCDCGDSYQDDETEALGHTWEEATCKAPKTCTTCGANEGEPAAHNYQGGKCATCGTADPSYKALTSGSWTGYKATNSPMPMGGAGMSQYKLSFGGEKMWSWRFFEALEEPDPEFMDEWIASGSLLQMDGKYYLNQGMAEMGEFTFTESGSVVNVNAENWGFSIVLERISGNQLKVTAINGDAGMFMSGLAVGDVFTWAE